MRYIQGFLVITGFFLAGVVSAQVEVTEIMYDLDGSDSGREWVEIYNNGSMPVDLSEWRFVEADTNHKLSVVSGDGTLEAGGFALIIDDTNPGFTGDVFKSSFSLSNTGEKIGLRDEALNDVDMLTYATDIGAAGNGDSLQKIDGVWKASVPTPGVQNVFSGTSPSVSASSKTSTAKISQSTSQTTSMSPQSGGPSAAAPKPQISAYAGDREQVSIVGAQMAFEASARGSGGEDLSLAHYTWTFGDGTSGEGKKIEHTYQYAGDYAVVLDVTSGMYTATDKIKVTVVPADIRVLKIGTPQNFFVEISNDTEYEVNLSGWKLKAGTAMFAFPKDTFIFPKKSITIGPSVTGFVYSTDVSLLYPSGAAVSVYGNGGGEEVASLQNRNFSSRGGVVLAEAGGVKPSASLVKSIIKTADAAVLQGSQSSSTDGLIKGNVAQMANVKNAAPTKDTGDGLFWGLMGVGLLVLIAIYAVLDRKTEPQSLGVKSEADLYKIIEIEDEG